MNQPQTAPTESALSASHFSGRGVPSSSLKWLMVTALLAACLGPTFISYKPIKLSWDDADYLVRAVAVSRASWSGDVHGLGAAMVSVHTPIMTFLGVLWGPLTSWSSVGNCFFTLAAAIASLAAVCLYMLLRIGVKPFYLVVASLCVGVSLGPYPSGVQQTQSMPTRLRPDFMPTTCWPGWPSLRCSSSLSKRERLLPRLEVLSCGVSCARRYFPWERSPK